MNVGKFLNDLFSMPAAKVVMAEDSSTPLGVTDDEVDESLDSAQGDNEDAVEQNEQENNGEGGEQADGGSSTTQIAIGGVTEVEAQEGSSTPLGVALEQAQDDLKQAQAALRQAQDDLRQAQADNEAMVGELEQLRAWKAAADAAGGKVGAEDADVAGKQEKKSYLQEQAESRIRRGKV